MVSTLNSAMPFAPSTKGGLGLHHHLSLQNQLCFTASCTSVSSFPPQNVLSFSNGSGWFQEVQLALGTLQGLASLHRQYLVQIPDNQALIRLWK